MSEPKMNDKGKWKLHCPHCHRIITGTSRGHCISNHNIHMQFCKSREMNKNGGENNVRRNRL